MTIKKHYDRSIKDVLQEYIGTSKRISTGINKARIDEIWKQEMGPVITSYTTKITLKDGVMKVFIQSAPLRKELHMGKDKIIKIMNESAGSKVVDDIEFY